MKYTDIKIQTLQHKDLILLLEINTRVGISSVMGNRYVQSNEKRKILYVGANNSMDGLCVNIYVMLKLKLMEMLN